MKILPVCPDEKPDNNSSKDKKSQEENATITISREQLLELAKVRGEKVKRYFVGDKSISAERIFSCQPSINDDEESSPSVEISL